MVICPPNAGARSSAQHVRTTDIAARNGLIAVHSAVTDTTGMFAAIAGLMMIGTS
jgi:hypothetical protein